MILFLSILLGTLLECQGLQAGFQYQYQYTGTISTWIPKDPRQSSGSALRAIVALQLTHNGDILVKASNIEVSEHNDVDSCKANHRVEFPYREMDQQDAALLEIPFLVHVNKTEVSYMEVPQEPVWVTNIRRGIVNTIPLIPLTGQHPPTLAFLIKEDTMIGNCGNWYSLLKLPNHLAEVENKKQEEIIEIDVQRETSASYSVPKGKGRGGKSKTAAKGRKTSSKTKTQQVSAAQHTSTIEDTLYILTRTLDGDVQECKDKHFTMEFNGNQESVERTQRSTEGTFLMRGEGTIFRLERAEVAGDFTIYTGDCDDEFIRTSSKQVLQLRTVTQLQEPFPITYVPERRTLSFSVADGPRSTIKEKLLGISPDEQQVQANREGIVEDIVALATVIHTPGQERTDFGEIFQRLVERMTILSWDEIEELITHVGHTERERYIIFQASLASGRDEVLTAIVEKMKDQSFRAGHPLLVFQIFEASTTPVRNPSVIPAMLEVVTDMGENEKVSKAASLLNIAKLANRYCIDSQTANTCDPGCDNDFIHNTFLPMLSQGLQDPLKWKKLLNVQAVCALGSPYSITLLQPIIDGTNNDDVDVRINAILCLTADVQPKTAIEAVFDTLVPLMNNPSEFPEIRSMAFLALTTWEPNLSWWEHVAILTWKEKSPQLVSFISSTLTSLSDGSDPRSKNAKKVVHLAKHYQHSAGIFSLPRSAYLYLEEVLTNCNVMSNARLAWLSSTKSHFPKSVYYRLQLVTVMGMTLKDKGAYITNSGKYLHRYLQSTILSTKSHEDLMTFLEIYEELKEELELPLTDIDDEEPFNFMLNMDPLILISSGEMPLYNDENQYNLVHKIVQHKIPIHFRLAESTLVFPSDLGLPVMIKHEEDYAITVGANFTARELTHIDVRLSMNMNHHLTLKTNTFVPWSHGFVAGVGVEANLDVTLPVTKISWQKRASSATVALELPVGEQMKIFSRSNVMYTSLTQLYHIVDALITPEESESTNLGRKRLRYREMHEMSIIDVIGIRLQQKWEGDFKQHDPFNLFNNVTNMQELHYNNFDYRIVLDAETPRTLGVTFGIKCDTKERQEEFTGQVRGQVEQEGDYYELFSQTSQSSFDNVDFEEVSDVDTFEQQGQHSQTFNTHLERMQAVMMPSSAGGKVHTCTVTMEPQNIPYKFEMAINTAVSRGSIGQDITTNIHKIHVTLMSHPASGVGDTHMACVDLRMEAPFLLPLVTKEILLETNVASNILLNLYQGRNCDGPPVLKLQGTVDVSSSAIQNMPSSEERSTCDGYVPRQIYPFYNQFRLVLTTAESLPGNIAFVTSELPVSFLHYVDSEGTGSNNELIVEAVLDTEKDEWNITLMEPRKTVVFGMAGYAWSSPFKGPNNLLDFEKVCHLTQQSVVTYDGLLHSFEPSSCWTTATIVPFSDPDSSISRYLDISVQVRFTDQWEVRLNRPASALVLDVTRSDLLVNEEPFSGHNEEFVLQRFQDSQMVGIGMIAVRVGDTVDIMVSDLYYGEVMGICGNNDEEPINDMMGPTGCLYTDPALHTIAWNTAGPGCSRFTIRNNKRSLADYRENCDKVVFQPTGISQQNVIMDCTEWKYDERNTTTGLHCKSKIPIPACRPGCQASKVNNKHVRYSCQMSSSHGHGGVQYGENAKCSTTVWPIPYYSGCFHE